MNVHAPLTSDRYPRLLWWVMLSGCAARFTAERSTPEALSGFLFWTTIFALCWILRASLRRTDKSSASIEKAGNVVALLGMLLFLFRLNSDGLIPALLAFLFAIQAATFVIAEKRLHAWLILAAAFAGLMFAAAESRSGFFLLCAVWFRFAMLTLLAFDQRTERVRKTLLRPIGVEHRSSPAFTYAALVLAFAVPIYLLVPKPAGLLLGGMQAQTAHDYRDDANREYSPSPMDLLDGTEGDERPAQSVNPTVDETLTDAEPESGFYGESFSNSDIERDGKSANGIVLYVKSSKNVYLRGKVYDRFESNRWQREFHQARQFTLVRGQLDHASGKQFPDLVSQTVEVVAQLDNVLVHAPALERLRFPGPSVRSYDDGVHEVPQALRADTTYSVESIPKIHLGRYILPEDHEVDLERYLQLSSDATTRLRDLAREAATDAPSALARALLLEQHLRDNYEYSYETIPQQGFTPLDTFLFDTKRGHCEYFASALAVMLRTQGIPSRVATGFSLGEPNPITGYYEVRGLDGHAWVEAHIEGLGWLMLEPTPFYPLPQESESTRQVVNDTDRYLDRLAQTGSTLDPDSIKTQLIVTARDAWMQTRHVLKYVAQLPRTLGWTMFYFTLAAALVLVAAYFAYLLVVDWRSNREIRSALARSRAADARAGVLILAEALESAATPRGYGRKPEWTLREYVGYLATTEHAVPSQFSDLFDESRYSDESNHRDPHLLVHVAESVSTVIERNRWPRARRAVDRFRERITEFFASFGR